VFARLVVALSPLGITKEEAAARRVTIEILEFPYVTVIGDEGDLEALEQMDEGTVEEAIERSISGYIYIRWLEELGLSIEKGAISEATAIRLERDVKNYVESCVALELGDNSVLEIDWSGRGRRRIVDQVYKGRIWTSGGCVMKWHVVCRIGIRTHNNAQRYQYITMEQTAWIYLRFDNPPRRKYSIS